MKVNEKKDLDNYKFKDIREKEQQLQVERKKRIVYHRLLQNAETENGKQEQNAIK